MGECHEQSTQNAKVGASTLAASGDAPVQWKIALGWMRDANMAASGRESHGRPTRSTSIGTLKWSKHNSAGPPVDDLVCHPAAIAQD